MDTVQKQIARITEELNAQKVANSDARVPRFLNYQPSSATKGVVGSIVVTVSSGTAHIYICTSATGGVFTWSLVV